VRAADPRSVTDLKREFAEIGFERVLEWAGSRRGDEGVDKREA
jgi:hypothetical protein